MKKNLVHMTLVVSLSAFLNVSCASKSGKGAGIGAGVGAAAGAGIGALVGGKKGAIIGGASGAITGAAVGAYMGKQKEKLEKELPANTSIEQNGNELIVRLPSGILFGTGESSLTSNSQGSLQSFAGVLKEYPATKITIEGHTDSTGPQSVNQSLSVKRAQSVQSFLTSQGVEMQRMNTMGLADTKPIADNGTATGRSQNRRVEVKIVPDEAKMAEGQNG